MSTMPYVGPANPSTDAQTTDAQTATGFQSVSQLKTAQQLTAKLRGLQGARQMMELQWRLYMAFYRGDQYAYISKTGRIEKRPSDETETPRNVVRLISNQIMEGTRSLVAKLTKSKPMFRATPGDTAASATKAAEMAEKLLGFLWEDKLLAQRLREVLQWAIICCQGYWAISWDGFAGKQLSYVENPIDGTPITDPQLEQYYRSYAQQMGEPIVEKIIYTGDVKVEVVSPFDVYIDPAARSFEDAKWCFRVMYLDPDVVRSRWPDAGNVQPDAIPMTPDITTPYRSLTGDMDQQQMKVVKRVYEGRFLPTPAMPQGRHVIFLENKILEDGPWRYPIRDSLYLTKFGSEPIPGFAYDMSPVSQALPIQKELNRTLSQIVQHRNLTVNPRMSVLAGSLRRRVTNTPGEIVEYTGADRPQWEQPPTLPSSVFTILEDIAMRLKSVFGLADVSEGNPPPNVDSALAIDLVQEMADDAIAPMVEQIERALGISGQLLLSLCQQYYSEPRLLQIMGSNGRVQATSFTKADISGDLTVRVEAGSAMPRTRAGRQARILQLVQMQVISPQQAAEYFDLADLDGIKAQLEAAKDQAWREHDKLLAGAPINASAIQDAMVQINQGLNPQTGQPLQMSENPQELLQQAALQPLPYEDFQAHLEVHTQFMTTVEFESLPNDVQQRFVTHWELTLDTLRQLASTQPQPVRTNLSIRTAATATEVSKILMHSNGVSITPDEAGAGEPTLDTDNRREQIEQMSPGAVEQGQQDFAQQQALQDAQLREAYAKAAKAEADAELAAKKAKQGPAPQAPKK